MSSLARAADARRSERAAWLGELREGSLADELARRPVVVLMGGTSSERAVSLDSGRGVLDALAQRPGAWRGPREVRGVLLDADGRWQVGGRALDPARALAELSDEALFFLALHGGEGENGVVQGFLEHARRAHTGSGVIASALCMDKQATRARLAEIGVRVAPAVVVEAGDHARRADALARARELVRADRPGAGPRGWFVKPVAGGSSVATRPVERDDPDGLERAVLAALAIGERALVEVWIEGVEATCGVLGNAGGDAFALPPVEIVPGAGHFFDYAQKYSADGALERCPAIGLAPSAVRRIEDLAHAAHRALGCDGASRTDVLVPADGEPVALEVNTLPGLTARSLLPRAASVAGLDYRELCLCLCTLALDAEQRRRAVRAPSPSSHAPEVRS